MKLRDKILAKDDMKKEIVFIKEWDVSVGVQSMTGLQRAEVLNIATSDGRIVHEKLHPELLIRCLFDPETGEQLFTDADRGSIMSKNASAIELLVSTAMNVSGLGSKAVEELEKNSGSDTLNGASTST